MSWDSYLDNLVAQSKDGMGVEHIDRACIIGVDGGANWTSAQHGAALKLVGTEGRDIATCFKRKDFSALMANGIRAEGKKYNFLRVEDDKLVLGKMKGHGAITLQSSKTAIVISHCPEGRQQGNTNKATAIIADYLESMSM